MAAVSGFHHVKLPVSDLARTRDWYERVLGFVVEIEFVDDGVLTGLALTDPDRTVAVALHHDPARASALTGFDAISLRVPDRDGLKEWRTRLDGLGERHGAMMTGHRGGTVLVGLHDPDGVEIRLYAD